MRILAGLVLVIAASGCWMLRGGHDKCVPESCDGERIVRCSSVKESYSRMITYDCEDGTTCRDSNPPGHPECVPK